MFKKIRHQGPIRMHNPSDHMANERTFLAWVRTSIAIMAFGFVVEKFSLFIKQITAFIGKSATTVNMTPSSAGYSSILGIFLVSLGGLMCVLAFIKYKKTEKQIEEVKYSSSMLLDVMLTLSIVLIGITLVIYLIHSVM